MKLTPRVKIATLAAAILAFFLLVLLVFLPTVLINKPEAKAALQQRLSDALGGEVAFDRVHLTLIPRICATVDHPAVSLPGDVTARARGLDICLKFLPLLQGRFIPSTVHARSLRVQLPVALFPPAGAGAALPDVRSGLAAAIEWLKRLPDTNAGVTDGELVLTGPAGPAVELRNIRFAVEHRYEGIECSLKGESNLAKSFSAAGRVNADSQEGSLRITLAEARPHLLYPLFLPQAEFQLLDSSVDLNILLQLLGPGRLKASAQGRAPGLTLRRSQREARLDIERFAAELELSEKRLAAAVTEVSLSAPRASAALTLVVDEEAQPGIDFRIDGRADAAGVRGVALAMLQELPEVREIFDIVRGGEVPRISVNLHGDSWKDLGLLKNIVIHGRLEDGRIRVPEVDIAPDEVFGDVLISGGILEGTGLSAHFRGTRAENGSLRIGLTPAEPVLQLDIPMRADLRHLPPILSQVVKNDAFLRELRQVEALSGTAEGRLCLEGTLDNVRVSVDASDLEVTGLYRRIPFPISFTGGHFHYDEEALRLNEVDIRVGRSSALQTRLELSLKGELPFEASAPQAVADLAENFILFKETPPYDRLNALEGVVMFSDCRLAGDASDMSSWLFNAAGRVKDLMVDSKNLPAPLGVASGPFNWQGKTISFAGWDARFGSSSVSGVDWEYDWTKTPQVTARAGQVITPVTELQAALESVAGLKSQIAALEPLSGELRLKDVRSHLVFPEQGSPLVDFQAALDGARIASPLSPSPLVLESGGIHVHGARIELTDVNALLGESSLRRLGFSADWSAQGRLALDADSAVVKGEDLYPVLSGLPALKALRGDVSRLQGAVTVSGLSLQGPTADPRRWRATAAAQFDQVAVVTTFLDEPLEIPSGRVSASALEPEDGDGSVFRLSSVRVRSGPHSAVVAGDIRTVPAGTVLDLDIVAESLDWEQIGRIADRIDRHRDPAAPAARGRLGLRTERLTLGRLQLQPFYADARFSEGPTRMSIERAGYCGMLVIGRMDFEGGRVDAYLAPVVDNLRLDYAVSCLSSDKSLYTGSFNLDGSLRINARQDDILRGVNGKLVFVAEDGTIKQSLFFARLFSLLNLTEIYRGVIPDLNSQGLDYKRMTAEMEITEGKLLISSWSVDGRTLWMGARGEIDLATLDIDFVVMVSPFKTIDRIINAIPGLRWILGGRLVAIPVKAKGTLEDPRIVPMAPSAVGTSILEMIERTLLLPIEIVQPLVPGMEPTESSTITK